MKVVSNNYKPAGPRKVYCTHCYSELAITAADMRLREGRHYVKCPCCNKDFFVMTDAETTEAYYRK
jgi:hypothetical protein